MSVIFLYNAGETQRNAHDAIAPPVVIADFFHLHWGSWSFYIFNLADVAITIGVILLLADLLGLARPRTR